jgi:outer membrane immunogenic protein
MRSANANGATKMRKAVVVAAILALSGSAFAADVPIYKAPRHKVPYVERANWTGFYAGINLGYGWGTAESNFSVSAGALFGAGIASDTLSPRGFIAGGQAGYNFQVGSVVYGLEGDLQYSGQSATGGSPLLCPAAICGVFAPAGISLTHKESITWFGTLRGRLGYDFGWAMLYGTGGLAIAGVESQMTATTPAATVDITDRVIRGGWTVGGGLEAMINRSWSMKAEYLYMDYGTHEQTFGLSAAALGMALPATITQSTRLTDNVIRVGVNHRF